MSCHFLQVKAFYNVVSACSLQEGVRSLLQVNYPLVCMPDHICVHAVPKICIYIHMYMYVHVHDTMYILANAFFVLFCVPFVVYDLCEFLLEIHTCT